MSFKNIRAVSEIELDYIKDSMSVFVMFSISKKVSKDLLTQAINKLIKTYPILKAKVINENFVYQNELNSQEYLTKLKNPLRVSELFNLELDPLSQLFRLYYSELEQNTWFCLIVHHSISDAKSACVLVEKLLFFLLNPLVEAEVKKPSPPIDLFLPYIPSFDETKAYADRFNKMLRTLNFDKKKSNARIRSDDKQRANVKIYEINQKSFNHLKALAKKHNVTINSLLIAAMFKGLNPRGVVSCGMAIDLKKHLGILESEVVNAPVGAFFFLDLKGNEKWFEIAANLQKMLKRHLESKDLLLQQFAMLREQIDPLECNLSFFLSNLGKTTFNPQIADSIEEISFSAQVVMNRPYIACMTHQDMMRLSVTYSDPWYSEKMVDELIHSITFLT